jgi:alpha-1,2-mannosyltransferase/arabinofuranan 3-O-arabinosyltransferase
MNGAFPARNGRLPLLLLAAGLWPVVVTVVAIAHDTLPADFASFYASGRAWLNGTPPYPGSIEFPNMNPPSAVLLLFAPLARLDSQLASLLWSALGLIALVGSWRLIARELDRTTTDTMRDAGLLALSVPAALVWVEGQMTWLLLYPITHAWIAYRNRRRILAGLWLGPVIAIKPFLALLPFALGLTTLLVSGLVSAGISGVAFAFTGLSVWRAWLDTAAAIPFLAYLNNASLWALPARAIGAETVSQLGWIVWGLIVVGGMLMLAVTSRERDADRRWLAAGLCALLLSPLGWVYYTPLFVGPLVAVLGLPSTSRVTRYSLVAFAIPVFVLGLWPLPLQPYTVVTIASIYTWSGLAIWFSLILARRTNLSQPIPP